MAGNRAYDAARQKAVILYVLQKIGRPITAEELSSILFVIDFEAYAKLGHSITGESYINVPDAFWHWSRLRQRFYLSGLSRWLTRLRRAGSR